VATGLAGVEGGVVAKKGMGALSNFTTPRFFAHTRMANIKPQN